MDLSDYDFQQTLLRPANYSIGIDGISCALMIPHGLVYLRVVPSNAKVLHHAILDDQIVLTPEDGVIPIPPASSYMMQRESSRTLRFVLDVAPDIKNLPAIVGYFKKRADDPIEITARRKRRVDRSSCWSIMMCGDCLPFEDYVDFSESFN